VIFTNKDGRKELIYVTHRVKNSAEFVRGIKGNYNSLSKNLNRNHSDSMIRKEFKKWNVLFNIGQSSRSYNQPNKGE
jgi:N6-adenosine-specific RNA methylase IME4